MQPRDLDALRAQYATADPLRVRLDTHRLYSERRDDLHADCSASMRLAGHESVVDVGPGPGSFEAHLRGQGHHGRLVAVDASRGMCAEGHRAAPDAQWLVGDAASLPLAAASFDWAVARHMLYHVPDIPAALREARRVLRPDGAMLVTTNGADSLPAMKRIRARAREAFGLDIPSIEPASAFTAENAPGLLSSVFPRLHAHTLQNALLFREPAPAAQYIASAFTCARSAERRPALMAYLMLTVTEEIERGGGVLRDPKSVAMYVARGA